VKLQARCTTGSLRRRSSKTATVQSRSHTQRVGERRTQHGDQEGGRQVSVPERLVGAFMSGRRRRGERRNGRRKTKFSTRLFRHSGCSGDATRLIGFPHRRFSACNRLAQRRSNFHKQVGIYLLYDGREVIYVGRASRTPIGKASLRAYGRHGFRPDGIGFRGSGLLPVSEAGALGSMPESYLRREDHPSREAILVRRWSPSEPKTRG